MHGFIRTGAAACAAIMLSGCSDLITGGHLIRQGEPTGVIEVVNHTESTMGAILISACEVGSYGLNRLPEGSVLHHGESYTFTVSAGCWDVNVGVAGLVEGRQRMQVPPNGGVRYVVTRKD